MEPWSEPANTVWPFPSTSQAWAQIPPAVQAYVHTLPAWHTSAAAHGAWRPVTIPTWRLVGLGHWQSGSGCVIGPRLHRPAGRAWYARLCKLIDQYYASQDEAGKLACRLLREMNSLWVFLTQCGVEPTNNRAERALRFGVLWRKRSLGTASTKGNR
jgi:hypothetical protein